MTQIYGARPIPGAHGGREIETGAINGEIVVAVRAAGSHRADRQCTIFLTPDAARQHIAQLQAAIKVAERTKAPVQPEQGSQSGTPR